MVSSLEREGIGSRVLRREDVRLLTGRGRFIDDLAYPTALSCYVVRSPHAHADIRAIDLTQARRQPGVVAIFTGADMADDTVGPMPALWQITSSDGTPMAEPDRWALARERVRHVGEPVAIVIAATREQAQDAAEHLTVDYAERPAVAVTDQALEPRAPSVHDGAPGNVCFRWQRGDKPAVDRAMADADLVVTANLTNNRLCGAAIETRGVIADYDPAGQTLTLVSTTQSPHHIRRLVAGEIGMSEARVRVISPDVGGGFGTKGKHYPEETILAWASRKLGRPIKWIGQRSESFLSDTQGRDHLTQAELGVDQQGRFLALRVNTIANVGAYVSTFGANIPSAIYSALLSGVYRTPAIYAQVTGVFTNTVPIDAYRGAGRPEACYVLERLADLAAERLGLCRFEIRQRNMVTAAEMPHTTAIGPTYDSGDFPGILRRVRQLSAYDAFAARRAQSAASGRCRGIGVASFVETSGIAPSRLGGALGARVGFFETAHIRVNPDGSVLAMLGTHNHGQGHETTFAQILCERLGTPLSRIDIVEGDSAGVPNGTGTFGSRSIAVGGTALNAAADKVIDKAAKIAAHLMRENAANAVFEDGAFAWPHSNKRIEFAEVARAAHAPFDFPHDELEPGLEAAACFDPSNFAFSNGAHVAEVEIDPATGTIDVLGYYAVDDIGTVINPIIVEGQIHGGVAQGLGQALMEACRYDRQSGQLLSGSFMDYALPRADQVPFLVSELDESQPCRNNPLGAKGCGESGTIAAPAAITGAVLDALRPLGVTDIEMPLTSERVWRAIEQVRQAEAGSQQSEA